VSDAVVIGAGPNGLVAANILVDAGWEVIVLEANEQPGGAVSSRLLDGAVTDVCSAFYPLAVASPPVQSLRLEEHGLRWCHAPAVLAHPMDDGRCPVLSTNLDETAASLEALALGDGDAWLRSYALWRRVDGAILDALFTPFPPVAAGARLAAQLGVSEVLRFARFAVLPVRRFLEEEFSGDGGLLVAGSALHADLAPEAAGSSFFGWVLAMLGQQHGWPVPQGGAGQLTAALVRRLQAGGGTLRCGERVTRIVVRDHRAVGVRTALGEEVPARLAVLADVVAPTLYGELVPWEHLPARLADDLRRFQWDWATFKVDWLLDGDIPWSAPEAGRSGTVHLGSTLDEMTAFSAQLAMGQVPGRPFVLLGQMSVADPTRSPAGTSTVWGYTHVPRQVRGDAGCDGITGRWDGSEVQRMADRIEAQIERFAPGFRARIRNRWVLSPCDLEAHDSNLVEGGINGGTAAIHQQLVFRPTPGMGRPETPVNGLYLASSSAHPGGGVHGACGANAARVALRNQTPPGRAGTALLHLARRSLAARRPAGSS
jgi:phytoene dehydrogenase-like protein